MPDLDVLLREVVDASAAPVTVDEVLGARQPRRWPLLAAAATVVLLAGAAAVALRSASDEVRQAEPAATTLPAVEVPPRRDCVVVPYHVGGCDVTDEQAEAMIGFELNEPAGIPGGWERTISIVRVYRAADWPDVDRDLVESNRAWFPPTNCGMPYPPPDGCVSDYLQVSIRNATGAEQLLDGPGMSSWVTDGRLYEVRWHGMTDRAARVVADSLV
jgi:hypothetical protein